MRMKVTTELGKEREAKLKGCKILAKLNLPHIRIADYMIVAEQVGIKWQQLCHAYKNWLLYGSVDRRNKHNNLDAIPLPESHIRFMANHPNYYEYRKEIFSSTKQTTDYRVKKAIKLYINGASVREVHRLTGISMNILYRSMERLEKTGRIGRYRIYTPMKDAPQLRIVLAVKYAKLTNKGKSSSESKIFKEMSVSDRLRYTQFYATIKEAINRK